MSKSPVEYIELNPSNYDSDDVSQLNEWAIWAHGYIEELEKQLGAMKELERQRWESAAKTFGIVSQTYTCNGAVHLCERERFGMCQWHEEREAT
jgi:hypothetical protein